MTRQAALSEGTGAFTQGGYFSGFDLPLLLIILFFAFFLCLVYYLRREDKREGYPLVPDPRDRARPRVDIVGFPGLPGPKTFKMPHGLPDVTVPRREGPLDFSGEWTGGPGGPLVPVGDPLLSRTGPAAWQPRKDAPDLSFDGKPIFRPIRWNTAFSPAPLDTDPRGMPILGCDKQVAGEVVDIWMDRSEHRGRFLEIRLAPEIARLRTVEEPRPGPPPREVKPVAAVITEEIVETPTRQVDVTEVDVVYAQVENTDAADYPWGDGGGAETGMDRDDYERELRSPPPVGQVLVPLEFIAISGRHGQVRTAALTAAQFANVPGRKSDQMITSLEEQKLRAYFGGGILFATPSRQEPLL